MRDQFNELPSFMTGIPKEAGAAKAMWSKAKNGLGSVKNWFRGAKATPAPAATTGTRAWGTAAGNTPITGSQYGAFTPKAPAAPAAAPSWMGRAKQVGGGVMNTLNAASTPLFAYSMMQDMWGGNGAEAPAAEADPSQQMQVPGQGQATQPGYYAGFDPRNEPMQGNAGDWFRGIFTRGRNPAVEQQTQQQHAAMGHYAAQAAGKG